MSNILKITADVTTVNKGDPIALDKTPLLGGAGREGILNIPVLPLTGVLKLQGAPANATGAAPGASSTDWTDLVTIDSTSDQVQQIDDLPRWIRYSTTTLDADGPDVDMYLEGVQ